MMHAGERKRTVRLAIATVEPATLDEARRHARAIRAALAALPFVRGVELDAEPMQVDEEPRSLA